MTLERNVSFAQFRGCLFLQLGATALILARLPGERSWGLELFTPARWVALRPFPRLILRRVRR